MANTTNFGWETPDDTDYVKDGAAAMRTLGNSIDTSFVDLKGGTSGQILSKASNTDLDYTWISANPGDITAVTAGTGISGGGTSGDVTITNSMATAIDAKGDVIVGTGADTFSRLAVGTNNQVLTADSSTATGLKWATPAGGGGKVLQVVEGTNSTQVNITSTTMTDFVTVTITPSASTSKILLFGSTGGRCIRTSSDLALSYGRIVRDSTDVTGDFILNGIYLSAYTSGDKAAFTTMNYQVLDSPASTSSITYRFQGKVDASGNTLQTNYGSVAGRIVAMEIGA